MKSILLVFLVTLTLLVACASPSAGTTTRTYRVNHSTGLYAAFDVDAAQLAVLSEGTELIPADGRASLFCDSIVEAGMTFNLCKVEVLSTGATGWVLGQWID